MIKELLANKFFVLILMLFLHILEDFHLQGILASMKQTSWWEKQLGSEYLGKYEYDWVPSLLAHAFEWTFMIMLPIFLTREFTYLTALMIMSNTSFHFVVDNSKCNLKQINLITDQIFHLVQILFTWVFFILL